MWHYRLIQYLPNSLIIQQFRDLSIIINQILNDGKPKSPVVEPVMQYPWHEFYEYCGMVLSEMHERNLDITIPETRLLGKLENARDAFNDTPPTELIFFGWHNDRYLNQCLYMLEELYDVGVISQKDWFRISRSEPVLSCDDHIPF
jgi:uncharacterized protein (TIGR02328 family)